MLSIENPPPDSDPPLPCPLKKKKLVKSHHLDPSSSSSLSSASFDPHQNHIRHHSSNNINPGTSNFCIRDYVFAVRRKDVKKNWPFSPENLQLCLKHGVKHPLPPFQSLGSVKDQSLIPCTVETASDVAIKSDDPLTTQKLALHTGKFKPRSENALPSTATSAHQSEIECLESDQPVLDQSTVKYPPLRSKTESMNKPTSKKCRLVVKFGTSSAEDVASNLTAASELMASSKTCPVCKMFSSSSNTTLNAHIDQCLASGSKPVSAPSSRVVRHKIKPRKIRLMADIYTTAKECTLEELDRRNGTSWAAMGSNSPLLDGEKSEDVHGDGKTQRSSLNRSRDSADEPANVYVDANGTKVRILSKLDDDGTMAKKHVKGSKEGKFFSVKKKRRHGKKKHKYLKLVPQSTKLLPHKSHTSQVKVNREGYSQEENQAERGAPKPIKLVSVPGSSRQWMPLKFTTVTKEPSKKGCRRNPSSQSDEMRLRDSFAMRNKVENVSLLSGNNVGRTERLLLPMKRNTDNSSNVSASLCRGPIPRSAENDRNCISPLRRRKICSSAGLGKAEKESSQFVSRTLEVLSPGKKVSIRHQSAAENKLCAGKTRFSLKKTGPQVLDEGDDDQELVAGERSTTWGHDLMQDGSENRHRILSDSSFGTSEPLSREDRLASESPRMVSQYFHRGYGEIADSSPRVLDRYDDVTSTSSDSDNESDTKDDDDHNDDDVLEDLDCREITEERAVTSLSRFLGTEFIRRSHSETPFDSSVDEYTGASSEGRTLLHSSEPSFLGGQEEYSARDDAGDAIHDQATRMDMDLDSETGQGSSFPEVEPIPIPGPPGSYLPSPRDMMMTSDDFPGQSSLTTSPVRSSEDHRDFIDRVSSDSPLSMASTVSNSRPDHMKYFEQLSSAGMAPGQEKNLDSAMSSLRTSGESGRKPEAENLDFNGFAIEKRPFGFRSDDQPCCCQRKERSLSSQGFISLNFQDSQLLKRRTMASEERHTGFLPNTSLGGLDPPRSELAAPGNPCTALESGPGNIRDMSMRRPLSDIDRTTTSPSASNPVLRLMGKNLMVINTEEETSMPLSHGGLISKPPVPLTAPLFHHTAAPRGSFTFDCDSTNIRNYLSSSLSSRVPQNLAQAPAGTFHSHYAAQFSLINPQDLSSAHCEAPKLPNSDCFSPIKLSCSPEDSQKIHRSSLVVASPSTTHLSSSLYYS